MSSTALYRLSIGLSITAIILALISLSLGRAHAFDAVGPTQAGVSQNALTTGAADTAVTQTIAAAANQRGRIYGLTARCSAGTATLTVTNGGTVIWSSNAGMIGTTSVSVTWTPVPLMGSVNSALVATLSSCASPNTGTLSIHGDRY